MDHTKPDVKYKRAGFSDADAILLCIWKLADRLDKQAADQIKDIIEDPQREGNRK